MNTVLFGEDFSASARQLNDNGALHYASRFALRVILSLASHNDHYILPQQHPTLDSHHVVISSFPSSASNQLSSSPTLQYSPSSLLL